MSALPLLLITILNTLIVVGCTPTTPVFDKTGEVEFREIAEVSEEYGSPVWLSAQHIAFINHQVNEKELGALFSLQNISWNSVLFEGIQGCVITVIDAWRRLPDGRLGFIYECRDANILLRKIGHYLIAWDHQTNEFEILREYDDSLSPYGFAVLPDFTTVFQESTGLNIHHKLYQVSLNSDDIRQLFSDYYRAGSPSISPSGKTVAFAANQDGPGSKRNLFTGFLNLRNEIFHPWHLYLMEVDGTNLRIVLSDIKFLKRIKWSPTADDQITFIGEYKGKHGLWLYNHELDNLTFLWKANEGVSIVYDWSPTGQEIVLLNCIKPEGAELGDPALCTPIIINVPLE